jgi:DNA-binding NtrC family response regulator
MPAMPHLLPPPAHAPHSAALAGIKGASTGLRALRERLPRLAASGCNVLITGETGTGKEGVAQALHELGPQHAGPFVSINCAALPDSLLDSELFGYERGAFTGAHSAYPGKIVLAHGGTLFLDEIGDMPLHAQAKLLRVLETREVFPIGALRSRKVSVRVVCATHQGLEAEVQAGRFRADLFYRLNVARVALQPLRERPEDIPVLFDHFATTLAAASGEPKPRLSPGALQRLMCHRWPGNVRELRNVVEAAGLVCGEAPLQAHELPLLPELCAPTAAGSAAVAGHGAANDDEPARIIEALEHCHWNRSQAASRLQWSRMTLWRKMKRLHIGPVEADAPDQRHT